MNQLELNFLRLIALINISYGNEGSDDTFTIDCINSFWIDLMLILIIFDELWNDKMLKNEQFKTLSLNRLVNCN